MNLKTAIAIAVAAAFAVPLAAQASADADTIILAQQGTGSTYEPRDSNPAAPPKAIGPGAGSTNSQTGEVNKDRPARSAAGGQSSSTTDSSRANTGTTNAPLHSGTNSADRPANEPKSGAGATAKGGFSSLDKNHDGYISRDEARDATWANRFTELDKDNDGRLSQSEFNAMQAGAGATGGNAGATRQQNAPLTSGTNSADRKPNTPKQ